MKKHIPFFYFLLLVFYSCQQSNPQMAVDSLAYEQFDDQAVSRVEKKMEPNPQQTPSQVERKLIKEGEVSFETYNIDSTRRLVTRAVSQYEGYVSSDQTYNYPNRISHTMVIRVPAEHFDAVLAAITQGIEKLDSKSIRVKDVTEEYVDIMARLKTQKELENKYTALLQRANSVSEILEIEREMGKLRGEIESIEGRLRYLENQVSLSTLTLTFYEETPSPIGFGREFSEGFRQGWENLIWFFVGLVNIWPFLLLIPLLIWGFRRIRRRRKQA